MSHASVTHRLHSLDCSDDHKKVLRDYLFACLADGKNFRLKRNRVMIWDNEGKNKFIILDLVSTKDENKQMYSCPKCTSCVEINNLLTASVPADQFKRCIHSELCTLIWGNNVDMNVDILEDDEQDLIEVIAETPRYMAVIHPSILSPKGPGVVVLTSKTLKPKCIVCKGQDSCIHLKIHLEKYKRGLEENEDDENEAKKLRISRLEPKRPQKKAEADGDTLDPYQHEGPDVNVFNVTIDFIQTQEGTIRNRKVYTDKNPFGQSTLIAKYDPDETCRHGNKYEAKHSIINVESTNILIHHTKEVESVNQKVMYRPVVFHKGSVRCICKKWYTGEDDQLVRVSPAYNRIPGRQRTLHFVSIELYFSFLGDVVHSGETMNAFIKSKKFLNEIYLGFGKRPEYRKVLSKGFDIFCQALKFPSDANYCYECPQPLEPGEKEDDFETETEYSVIDAIQMGCRTQDNKSEVKENYFTEELVEDSVVGGIEAKDRTFLNTRKVRNIVSDLLSSSTDMTALGKAIKNLSATDLDENARSVLDLLNRINSEHKFVPQCYIPFLHELQLETPISALMVPYSSDRETYEKFMDYLNNKTDIFSSPDSIEIFINKFPIIVECFKFILDQENSPKIASYPFLPSDVSVIVKNMIKLRFHFDRKSRKCAAPRVVPKADFVPPKADCFPNYPIHTMENRYKADRKPDDNEDDCEKNFASTSSISGGIGTVSCNHKITKGFRAIQKGESPVIFCHSLLRRLPNKVKAKRRVVVYDFACKLHKCCLRRYPYRIRRFQFVIDRHHQTNHKACSQAYNISKYPAMNHLNTQIAEQLNNSLRKLSTVVAYSNFDTYLKIIEIFVTIRNLKIKRVI